MPFPNESCSHLRSQSVPGLEPLQTSCGTALFLLFRVFLFSEGLCTAANPNIANSKHTEYREHPEDKGSDWEQLGNKPEQDWEHQAPSFR